MRVEIRRRQLELSDGLRAHIERQLRTDLGRFAGQVAWVWVYLGDVNGPRGGEDKRCRIVVHFARGGGRAVASGIGTDPYAAVTQASDRAARIVKRRGPRNFARRSRLRERLQPA